MNEEKPTLQKMVDNQIPSNLKENQNPVGNSVEPSLVEHPLHMLDNQADPETKPKIILQKPLRTYEGDIAEILANKKTSVVSMAIAENQRKNEEDSISNTESLKSPRDYRKIFITILSIILVLGGISGGYYLYLKSPLAPIDIAIKIPQSQQIIKTDLQKSLSINGLGESQIIQLISSTLLNENIQENKINEIILTQTTGSTTIKVNSIEFLQKINANMPDSLLRSLTGEWIIGAYNIENEKLPFIILSTNFFQNTYAGMLKWESLMPDKFANLFNYKDKAYARDSISTTSISSLFTIRGKFEDRTILNRDVREFRNDRGELLVLYSFIDKNTLIMATSETTLKAIIGKIENQTYIR